MRRFNALVFDDLIMGWSPVFTASRYDAPLAQFDNISLQAVVDNADFNGSLRIFIDHSGDGRSWDTKNGGSSVLFTPIKAGATTTATGTEPIGELSMGFVRLRMVLVTTTRARARVYATARDAGG